MSGVTAPSAQLDGHEFRRQRLYVVSVHGHHVSARHGHGAPGLAVDGVQHDVRQPHLVFHLRDRDLVQVTLRFDPFVSRQ